MGRSGVGSVMTSPTLVYYDVKKRTAVSVEASSYGIHENMRERIIWL